MSQLSQNFLDGGLKGWHNLNIYGFVQKNTERRRKMQEYAGIGAVLLVAIIFPIVVLLVSRLVHPKKTTPEKLLAYECGNDTQGDTWVQFKVSYFMYALIFVAFDVETVFLYPWAMRFKTLLLQGSFAFVEMFIFILILLAGYCYAWKEGALEWM